MTNLNPTVNPTSRTLVRIYRAEIDSTACTQTAIDRFLGVADTPADWMYEWLECTGQLDEIPERFRSYVDYDGLATDCRLNGDFDFVKHGRRVWVFSTH